MRLFDITNDTQTLYRLDENEQAVFFMLNRSSDITFELTGEGAAAHVISFFVGTGHDTSTLTIAQRHLAPRTTSHVVVKSVLREAAQLAYQGTIHIAPEATLSDASLDNRNLLLSNQAKAFSQPALEILTSDVRCRHAAATGPLNQEQVRYLQTRGISCRRAEQLLISGFFRSTLDSLEGRLSHKETEKMVSLMKQLTC